MVSTKQNNGDAARLLTMDQKESSFNNKSKKKGIFSVFHKKKNANEDYLSRTAPSTPEAPINVTVLASEYDPSKPYGMAATQRSSSSGLTERDGAISPVRKVVGFANLEKVPEEGRPTQHKNNHSLTSTLAPIEVEANADSTTATPATGTAKVCNGDLVTQTLGYFDDICQVPNNNGPNGPNISNGGREWGTVPSEDDEESTFMQSLQSTMDGTEGTTNDPATGSMGTTTTTANNRSVEVDSKQQQQQQGLQKSPSHDHENFEVVLDSSLLKGEPEGKRRGWFKKQREYDEEEEEKKMEDEDVKIAHDPTKSPGRKSLVKRLFSVRKKKDEEPEDKKMEDESSLFGAQSLESSFLTPSQLDVLSTQEEPMNIEHTAEEHVEKRAVVGAVPVTAAAAAATAAAVLAVAPLEDKGLESKDSWNNFLEQLNPDEATTEKKKPDDNKKAVETSQAKAAVAVAKPATKQKESAKVADNKTRGALKSISAAPVKIPAKEEASSSKDKRSRSRSWGSLAKKISKPIQAVRSRSKDGSGAKYESDKPPLVPPTAPVRRRKLKPTWKAVVDPNSGKTYYYHRKTRATSWKKPEELVKLEQDADATPVHKNQGTASSPANAMPQPSGVDSPHRSEQGQEVSSSGNPVFKTPPRRSRSDPKETTTPMSMSGESPMKPPLVVEAAVSAESHQRITRAEQGMLGRSFDEPAITKTKSRDEQFDDTWEKKKEIERLLTGLSPPDKSSVDKLMKDYDGKEDLLLRQLRDKVESQPFDEPFLDEPGRESAASAGPNGSPSSDQRYYTRTTTYLSRASATTKSSTKTDKTERIKNTLRGKGVIETISENQSTSTSISSRHEEDRLLKPHVPAAHPTNHRIPSKVPVPRERELMVEELDNSRIKSETFDTNGRVVRGRARDNKEQDDGSYYGDNEVDTVGTDSVSALSENDMDFMNRKDNFEQARRRALDDAIEREDWDLAAALSEGMRTSTLLGPDYTKEHSTWNQSELDKFIANNDWDAMKGFIARMRDGKTTSAAKKSSTADRASAASPNLTEETDSIVKAPSRGAKDLAQDASLTKRIGSRSQLQHRELLSESSWTSDSSYDSYDSEYS